VKTEQPSIKIAGIEVAAGQRTSIHVPVARRYTHAEVFLPVHVVCGRRDGPRLFISAAIHGDEINGVEITRRLLLAPALKRLRGVLIAVPVVNVYGFINHQRYLPDRRDLNRSFPGTPKGSLASRLAHQFMTEIVANSTHGIDLHTGSLHRSNLPHVRACLDDPETARLARAFGTPVLLNANVRDGSLRQAVVERKVPMLLFEGGEALRFDEMTVRAGVRGILNVMRALGMLKDGVGKSVTKPFIARSSVWVRAPDSGILHSARKLGTVVSAGERLGVLSNPLGEGEIDVEAPSSGVLVGCSNLPLVNEGDALFHIARFSRPASIAAQLRTFQADLGSGEPGDDAIN